MSNILNSDQHSTESKALSRREVLMLAAGVTASTAFAGGVAMAGADHSGHSHHSKNQHESLIDSAFDCMKTGQLCLDHCMELFKQGETGVAECADRVNELLAMCTALTQMAAYRSNHLVAFSKVCIEVCQDCEEECRKHEDMHAECRACADSCADCIKELEKVIA